MARSETEAACPCWPSARATALICSCTRDSTPALLSLASTERMTDGMGAPLLRDQFRARWQHQPGRGRTAIGGLGQAHLHEVAPPQGAHLVEHALVPLMQYERE